jgi:hypothetical protein
LELSVDDEEEQAEEDVALFQVEGTQEVALA